MAGSTSRPPASDVRGPPRAARRTAPDTSAPASDEAAQREPPTTAEAGWTLTLAGLDPVRERTAEALLAIGNGRIGTRGTLALPVAESEPGVRVCGVYRGSGPSTDLLPAPIWNVLAAGEAPRDATRVLDLRHGVLHERIELPSGTMEVLELLSLADPALGALRVRAPAHVLWADQGLPAEAGSAPHADRRVAGDQHGSVAAAVADRRRTEPSGAEVLERVVAFAFAERDGSADVHAAAVAAAEGQLRGFDALLAEHERAWDERWAAADVLIEGDAADQLALRLGLYHLIAATPRAGEAAVGARGLSGAAYRGHVFWDAEAYVLPFHAATDPRCARAMLEYRIARLPAARAAARAACRAGACFPWESAADGNEVTPPTGTLPSGEVVPIRTGDLEDHVVADIAWAAQHYVTWSGDRAFADGPGRGLLVDTARFWASRIVVEHGAAHIRGVIGPDEYHEDVDDNAYTNVMARWNLRAAAAAVRDVPALAGEADHWSTLAERLVDGYDAVTGLYEQHAGFFALEPLIVADAAPTRPVNAPMLLGPDRVAEAQVLKQADVLMLHYLVPEEVQPGSLAANLAFYEPRTAHGSTLSPGVHATLLARAGRPEEALRWLRVASRIDLDDLSGTTAGGVHLAAMGSAWRAVAWGLAGLSATDAALVVDPRPLPAAWDAVEVRVRYRGVVVRVRLTHDAIAVHPAAPVAVRWPDIRDTHHVDPEGTTRPWPHAAPGGAT